MVNGNDMVEFEEQHFPELVSVLAELEALKQEFPAKYSDFADKVEQYIKEWVMNEFANYGSYLCDMYEDNQIEEMEND